MLISLFLCFRTKGVFAPKSPRFKILSKTNAELAIFGAMCTSFIVRISANVFADSLIWSLLSCLLLTLSLGLKLPLSTWSLLPCLLHTSHHQQSLGNEVAHANAARAWQPHMPRGECVLRYFFSHVSHFRGGTDPLPRREPGKGRAACETSCAAPLSATLN